MSDSSVGSSTKDAAGAYDDDDNSHKEEEQAGSNNNNGGGPTKRYDRLERLKREKRLAMNRECARARRRRKKLRMELLEGRVQELNQKNLRLQEENEALLARSAQLEMELNRSRSMHALSFSGSSGGGAPGAAAAMGMAGMGMAGMGMGGMGMAGMGMGGAGFGFGMGGVPGAGAAGGMPGGFFPGMNMNAGATPVSSAELELQRRAAMVGLGGAKTGLGGAASSSSAAAASSGAEESGVSQAEKLKYMQFMQHQQQQQNKRAEGMHASFLGGAGAPFFAPGLGAGAGFY